LSLGGRPKEEDGHKPINVSVDVKTYEGLEKIRDMTGNRSKFIENALRPLIHQLDPGESCEVLDLIDTTLNCRITSALSKQDFEMAATLATMGNSLAPFRVLCRGSGSGYAIESRERPLESGKPYEDTVCHIVESFLAQIKKASGL